MAPQLWQGPPQTAPAFHRTPTFVVENGQQRELLDRFQRREQHFDEEYKRNKPLCFNARAYQKSHPYKIEQGKTDADATLVSPMMVGVADGVSQIEDFGIDPSELPKELLAACNDLAMEQLFPHVPGKPVPQDKAYRGPIPLMTRAFKNTESLGSTTVLLGILDNSTQIHGKLHPMIAVLSIGDCELLVLRRTNGKHNRLEAVFHTEMQRIDGNAQAPLQVARVDERVDANFDEGLTLDVIERGSAVHCMSAYEGDIVVMGSDGVFDNLFLDEITDLCNEYLQPLQPGSRFVPEQASVLDELAKTIVHECHNRTKTGPNGERQQTPIGRGGKVDDTCCVVGQVIEWTNQHNEVWSRVRQQRENKKSGSALLGLAFCGFQDIMFTCGGGDNDGESHGGSDYNGSDHGSDKYPSEHGSEYDRDTDNYWSVGTGLFSCRPSGTQKEKVV